MDINELVGELEEHLWHLLQVRPSAEGIFISLFCQTCDEEIEDWGLF